MQSAPVSRTAVPHQRRLNIYATIVLVAGMLGPASSPGQPTEPDGAAVYNYYCYQCHGYSGDAQTVAARYLVPPPRDFTASVLSRERMLDAVTNGRRGTAMTSFATVLTPQQIDAVVSFTRQSFMGNRPLRGQYHTEANGWPRHDRYAAAFPFVQNQDLAAAEWHELTPQQRRGRSLYERACITCHDQADPAESLQWELHALSYPRRHYSHRSAERIDLISGASPYAVHDEPPQLRGSTPQERLGADLYQQNCAFCHAADGSGRNWIGSFLSRRPRDLAAYRYEIVSPAQLRTAIRNGVAGTAMPAWKHVLEDVQIDAIVAYLRRAFDTSGP